MNFVMNRVGQAGYPAWNKKLADGTGPDELRFGIFRGQRDWGGRLDAK